MKANILDPRRCDRYCSRPGGPASEGDVHRCMHGRIWYCTGNTAGYSWMVEGYWEQLSPLLDWSRYRRAKRALAEAATPTRPPHEHP